MVLESQVLQLVIEHILLQALFTRSYPTVQLLQVVELLQIAQLVTLERQLGVHDVPLLPKVKKLSQAEHTLTEEQEVQY